jgi:putative FmdB family regulatory protein
MPTYEYECESCDHRFEEFQSIMAKPIEMCPVCQGVVRRLIGAGAGFLFKGSGFYQTDYRSSSYQKKADAEKKKTEPEKKPQAPVSSASGAEKSSPSSSPP